MLFCDYNEDHVSFMEKMYFLFSNQYFTKENLIQIQSFFCFFFCLFFLSAQGFWYRK